VMPNNPTMIPDMVMPNNPTMIPDMVMPNNPVNFKDELLYSDPNMGNNINTGTFKIGKTPASGLLDLKNFNKRIS
jgi:hypothetical protein